MKKIVNDDNTERNLNTFENIHLNIASDNGEEIEVKDAHLAMKFKVDGVKRSKRYV